MLEIGKYNGRLNPGKTQREPTFQVVMDALALTLCYFSFLTTKNVPKICPRVHDQDFVELPTDEVIVSFFKELGHTREIKSIIDVVVDQMHQPWKIFATIINRSLSGKTTDLDKLRVTPLKKIRKFKKPASPKLTTVLASDNPGVFVLKKKAPTKADRGKGIDENDDDSGSGSDAQDSEKTDSYEEENPNLNLNVDEEEETQEEEYVHTTNYFIPTGEETNDENKEFDDEDHEMRETKACKTYLGYATGVTPLKKIRKFKKPASPKLTTVLASHKEPTKKSKRVKRPAKKCTNAPTIGVVIKDTPGVFVLKKKAPTKVDRGKGIELLSDAALLKDDQLKKALMKNRQETHKLQASGSSEGTNFELEIKQRKTFYAYAQGLESSHDVYFNKRILVVTRVEEMQKHGYRLMRLDELYKFNDGTLTRLRTSLDDITKNIQMEYLPQRRWSSLEKKRAHIMIKSIDKQLKERRMMRRLEKFVGRRHYRTDLRLLQ
nr:hypothetical protein [Tanacetum cinerariifolium]